jgi:general secretion pathway protein G
MGRYNRYVLKENPFVHGPPAQSTDAAVARGGSRIGRQRGFTLLEVMVVVVILGILAALVVPKIISRPDEARITAAKQDIASLVQTLKLYRLDNQRYPSTEQGLQALVSKPTTSPVPPNWKAGGYIERLAKDPWGHPYQYLNPGVRGEIDVYSFGADGAPGGEANDADIGSWSL